MSELALKAAETREGIDITPEMIEAGHGVFIDWACDGDFEVDTKAHDLIKGIFLAMVSADVETSPLKDPAIRK